MASMKSKCFVEFLDVLTELFGASDAAVQYRGWGAIVSIFNVKSKENFITICKRLTGFSVSGGEQTEDNFLQLVHLIPVIK
jgi:hypothetical protein